MRKFLKLIEENRPGEDKYTVELRDVNGEVIDAFELFGVSSPFDIFDSFKQEYAADIPIEDNEMLQAQAEAGNPMAAQAIADREEAIQSLAAAYQQETEQIVAAAGDMQSGVVKV